MMMKNLVLIALSSALSFSAHAKGFMGKVGPFTDKGTTSESFQFKKCDASLRTLHFLVERTGKYHIPEIRLKSVTVRYASGADEMFEGNQNLREFEVELDPAQGCPTAVTLNARSTGFSPGHTTNTASVEVWGY
jgi:hypothetical protein